MRKMVNINDDNYERVREIAKEKKITMTTIINQAIEGYLNGVDFAKKVKPELEEYLKDLLSSQLKKHEKKGA